MKSCRDVFILNNESSYLTVKKTMADALRLACDECGGRLVLAYDEGGTNWGLERDPSGGGARGDAGDCA